MAIQDALYTLEVGQGRRVVQLGAILVGFVFLALLYLVLVFRGFYHPGAMDTAQLARQLATGHGYTTKFIRPAAVRQMVDYYNTPEMMAKQPQPKVDLFAMKDISNAPVYPAVLSVLFRISGVDFDPTPNDLAKSQIYMPERLIVIFNQFCIFLTAIVLYFWAWRMFDDRVAFVATIAFVGCDLIWQFALTGLSTSWVMLLVTALGLAIHEVFIAEEEDRRLAIWGWTVGSAVLLVLAILSRLSLTWLLIPYAAVMMVSLRRLVVPALVAIAIVVVGIAPWYARNYLVCHNPLGSGLSLAADSSTESEAVGERTYNQEHGWPVKRAIVNGFNGTSYNMANFFMLLGSNATVLLFVAALLHRFKRQRTQFIRWYLLGSILFISLGGSILCSDPKSTDEGNMLILLYPGIAAIGGAFFYVLLDRLDIGLQILRYIAVTVFLVICNLPLFMTLLHPGVPNFRYPPYFPPMIRYVSLLLQPQELMVSDIAAATAWYGDRTSLWMPASLKEFYDINDSVQTASGMLLTPLSWDVSLYKIDKGANRDWAPILRRQGLPSGFPLTSFTAMPPMENEYLFFSDRRRW